MSFVLDCSATLAWALSDEGVMSVDAVFEEIAKKGAFVPSLWSLEVANALTIAARRNRISFQERNDVLYDLSFFEISIDSETDRHAWKATLLLADHYKLTVYDASYLELAQRKRLPLVTLDKELCSAAKSAGVELR